jgi:excisionase family DNA binding protein
MEPLVNVEDAARLLSISPYTVRFYVRTGKLCPIRIGRRIVFSQNELQRFIEEATSNTTNPRV